MLNNYISIGKILNFHGVQGEAKVGYSKNQADFLRSLSSVFVIKDSEYVELKVKYVKFNNKNAIIKFEGINSINELLVYKGFLLYVPKEDFEKSLNENEYLFENLIGLEVLSVETDKKIGLVVGVSNNGATDLLSIRGLSQKISLVPFVDALVPKVDVKNKKIYVNDIQGLIE